MKLISNWYTIQQMGWISTVLAIYVEARDRIFLLIEWPFWLMGLTFVIPAMLKDLIVVYGVPFGAMLAASRTQRLNDLRSYQADPEGFGNMIRAATRERGRGNPEKKLEEVVASIGNPWLHYRRSLASAIMWPRVVATNILGALSRDASVRRNSWAIFRNFVLFVVIPVLAAFLFFFLDYLNGTYKR